MFRPCSRICLAIIALFSMRLAYADTCMRHYSSHGYSFLVTYDSPERNYAEAVSRALLLDIQSTLRTPNGVFGDLVDYLSGGETFDVVPDLENPFRLKVYLIHRDRRALVLSSAHRIAGHQLSGLQANVGIRFAENPNMKDDTVSPYLCR